MGEAREGTSINATTQLSSENDSGAAEIRGYAEATLLECLNRLGEQPNPVVPATRASGESDEGYLTHTDQRHLDLV